MSILTCAARSIHTDGCLAAGGTVLCRDLEKAVRINLEGGNKFSLASWHGRNAVQLEFTEQAIVTALRPLSFVAANCVRQTTNMTVDEKKHTPGT